MTDSDQSTANIASGADDSPQNDAPTFPLIKLPPELRLNIFDHVLTELTTTRQSEVADLETWHAWDQWPDNDSSTFLSLLLTSKEINSQVKKLWENTYAHKCIFYFWDMAEFYRVANSATALGAPYRNMRFVLRSKLLDCHPHGSNAGGHFETVKRKYVFLSIQESGRFIIHEFGLDWYDVSDNIDTLDESGNLVMMNPIPNGTKISVYEKTDGTMYVRADYQRYHKFTANYHGYFKKHRHGTDGLVGSYSQTHGEFVKVSWGDYDPAIGYAKSRIYREWAKRGFPTAFAELKDILHSWYKAARKGDQTWLAIGSPEKFSTLLNDKGFSYWFCCD